jgi:hypothetical protein
MSNPLAELENLLKLLIVEHRQLLVEVERHQTAIKTMNVAGLQSAQVRQEALRLKIAALESRRATVTAQLSHLHKTPGLTLTKLAELNPPARKQLLAQRDELRTLIGQITQRTHVAGKVAHAVLGHLNTVVRLLGIAMQQAGVYTRQGVPRTAQRIGVIEAVG